MKGTEILTTALEESVEGQRKRGRIRLKLTDTIRLEDDKTTKRKAWDRSNWIQL